MRRTRRVRLTVDRRAQDARRQRHERLQARADRRAQEQPPTTANCWATRALSPDDARVGRLPNPATDPCSASQDGEAAPDGTVQPSWTSGISAGPTPSRLVSSAAPAWTSTRHGAPASVGGTVASAIAGGGSCRGQASDLDQPRSQRFDGADGQPLRRIVRVRLQRHTRNRRAPRLSGKTQMSTATGVASPTTSIGRVGLALGGHLLHPDARTVGAGAPAVTGRSAVTTASPSDSSSPCSRATVSFNGAEAPADRRMTTFAAWARIAQSGRITGRSRRRITPTYGTRLERARRRPRSCRREPTQILARDGPGLGGSAELVAEDHLSPQRLRRVRAGGRPGQVLVIPANRLRARVDAASVFAQLLDPPQQEDARPARAAAPRKPPRWCASSAARARSARRR